MIEATHITIAIVGYIIVFFVLVLLSLVFAYIPNLLKLRTKLAMRKKGEECKKCDEVISADTATAICLALYMHFNVHDIESTRMTIKKVEKQYSPWSSKIHGISTLKR